MKYSKQQILLLATAAVFLVGAIFMLINTFNPMVWAFAVGITCALLGVGSYITMTVLDWCEKKVTYSAEQTSNNEHGKTIADANVAGTAEQPETTKKPQDKKIK